tara:strand:- start:1904 stop:2179 length:276 start_codon:yes stop_codon:yes gene_type:complete
MERKIIILLTFVLIVIGVTGCTNPTSNTPGVMDTTRATPTEKPIVGTITEEDTPMPTVSKMGGIAHALGCMFAPNTCQAKKDLGETEENKQ